LARKIQVEILGDSNSLEAALGRAQTKTSKFGKSIAVASKFAAGALLGLGVAAKIGFDEMEQHQKVAAQTAAVIESQGNAANITAKQVNALAQSLLNKSGVDDEVIQSGENVLLTFRNIRNEAGKGNDIFNQATTATLNLSVALGKNMTSASLLVGKALNDPIKGMTALTRAGVQFTDKQKATITALIDSGHEMQAQKIILGELTKEFGGSAEAAGKTLPGQLNILKETFKNVAGELTTSLIPAILTLAGVLSTATHWMQRNQRATKIIVVSLAALAAGVLVVNAAYKVWRATTIVLTAAQAALDAALLANPVGLIVLAVIALGVAMVVAYKKSETFRKIVGMALSAVRAYANYARAAFDTIVGAVQRIISAVQTLIGYVHSLISALGQIHVPDIGGALGSLKSGVGGLIPGFRTSGGITPGGGGGQAQVHLYLDGKVFYSAMVSVDKDTRRRTGRSLIAGA
jgi:hypothetical protein